MNNLPTVYSKLAMSVIILHLYQNTFSLFKSPSSLISLDLKI